MLSVGDVEYFPAQRQLLLLAPWHREALAEAHVQGHVAGGAQDISLASFAGVRRAVALISGDGIAAKQFRWIICVATGGAGLHWNYLSDVALHFPVGGPLARIVGLAVGQSGVPAVNARNLPAADQGIQRAIHVA